MKIRHIILILCILLILYLAWLSSKSVLITNIIKQKRINFLLLGVDYVDHTMHSDTIIFVSYSPKQQVLNIVSIPRDAYVDVDFTKFKKLAEIYAFFYARTKSKKLAAKEFKTIIEEKLFLSSSTKIEIPYFFVVDYQNFEKLIDVIGKIKIFVEEPMHYDDYAGNLHIHFEPGTYYMNGKDALKFVRYRGQETDISRIKRQQVFIKSLLNKLFNPLFFYKLPIAIYYFNKCFITNMSFWEILNLTIEIKNLKHTNIRFSTLSGNSFRRYLEINKDQLNSLIEYLINDDFKISKNIHVVLKVYNATEYPKLAKQVAMFLRQNGYDVLSWGNWHKLQNKSKIIDYSQNEKLVSNLCNLLCINDVTSVFDHGSSVLQRNILIILGQDFLKENRIQSLAKSLYNE